MVYGFGIDPDDQAPVPEDRPDDRDYRAVAADSAMLRAAGDHARDRVFRGMAIGDLLADEFRFASNHRFAIRPETIRAAREVTRLQEMDVSFWQTSDGIRKG